MIRLDIDTIIADVHIVMKLIVRIRKILGVYFMQKSKAYFGWRCSIGKSNLWQ